MPALSDFSAPRLLGGVEPLSTYVNGPTLIVNVASMCGFTPQYEGLEKLWQDYGSRGLSILGFPCNQFGDQEMGSAAEIASFCSTSYNVTFPMFAKVEVNGPNAAPLFVWLKKAAPGFLGFNDVKWNFTKFLVAPGSRSVKRYASTVEPKDIARDIEAFLTSG